MGVYKIRLRSWEASCHLPPGRHHLDHQHLGLEPELELGLEPELGPGLELEPELGPGLEPELGPELERVMGLELEKVMATEREQHWNQTRAPQAFELNQTRQVYPNWGSGQLQPP